MYRVAEMRFLIQKGPDRWRKAPPMRALGRAFGEELSEMDDKNSLSEPTFKASNTVFEGAHYLNISRIPSSVHARQTVRVNVAQFHVGPLAGN